MFDVAPVSAAAQGSQDAGQEEVREEQRWMLLSAVGTASLMRSPTAPAAPGVDR